MASPWTPEEISTARALPLLAVIDVLGAYCKIDKSYAPSDPRSGSKRVHVSFQGREFRFILTGEKFINELLSKEDAKRGGGGAIDFVSHITGFNFVQAVKVCLDARAITKVG